MADTEDAYESAVPQVDRYEPSPADKRGYSYNRQWAVEQAIMCFCLEPMSMLDTEQIANKADELLMYAWPDKSAD